MDYVSVLASLIKLDVAGNDPFDIEHFGFDHISPDLLSFFSHCIISKLRTISTAVNTVNQPERHIVDTPLFCRKSVPQ
jgi:hypothetical protein